MLEENQEERAIKLEKPSGGVSIRVIGAVAIAIAILLAFFAFSLAGYVADVRDTAVASEQRYVECSEAVDELQAASDFLTTQARMFVTTGRRDCMDAYLDEINVANRRGNAVKVLKSNFNEDHEASAALEEALKSSDKLAKNELSAMRLAAEYYGITDLPEKVANASISAYETASSSATKLDVAKELVLGTKYDEAKTTIKEEVNASAQALLEDLNSQLDNSNILVQNLLFQLRIAIALLLCIVMILVLVLLMYVLKPLDRYIKRIEVNGPLEADGSYELRYLANAYNAMYEDNSKRIEQLRALSERDPLTGISNRNGYDNFLAKHTRNIALLLIDVDNFKEFNQVYGRDTGDAVLKKLADAMSTAFRSTDFPCRIESDLFAVIMTNMNAELRDAVTGKIDLVNSMLADDSDDLPLVTISVGAAFSAEGMNDRDIYRAADVALRMVQQSGRNGIAFYGESYEGESSEIGNNEENAS